MKPFLQKIIALCLLAVFLYDTTFRPLDLWLSLQEETHSALPQTTLPNEHGGVYTFKRAISLPYSTDWNTPIAAEGLVEVGGEFFTLIDKQLKGDTLYIRAVRNDNARMIFNSLAEHIQSQLDKESTNKQTSHSSTKILLKVFHLPNSVFLQSINYFFCKPSQIANYHYQLTYQQKYCSELLHPPQA